MKIKMNEKEYNKFIKEAEEVYSDVKYHSDGNNWEYYVYKYKNELWSIEGCNGSVFNNKMIAERQKVNKKTRTITETIYEVVK